MKIFFVSLNIIIFSSLSPHFYTVQKKLKFYFLIPYSFFDALSACSFHLLSFFSIYLLRKPFSILFLFQTSFFAQFLHSPQNHLYYLHNIQQLFFPQHLLISFLCFLQQFFIIKEFFIIYFYMSKKINHSKSSSTNS